MKIKSKASRLKPVPQCVRGAFSGTGFSREGASRGAGDFADRTPSLWERACSRMLHFKHQKFGGCTNPFVSKLTPTSPWRLICPRSALDLLLIFPTKQIQTPQDATWVQAERRRRGVGRAARTWMSVRRGPTERRRSEGTRRRMAKPRASTLGYLGMVRLSTFPGNSPKAKRSAPQADAPDLRA